MNKIKITAIGEILYDVYPDQKRLGGAPFNFIYHVWKFLDSANFISSVGNDENGEEMMRYLNSIRFKTDNINIDKNHPTGTVYVTLDEDKSPRFIISSECSFDYLTLNESSKKIIENETDLLCFGTFTTRSEMSKRTIESVLKTEGIKYFCDLNLRHNFYTKEFIDKTLRACSVIKINREEFEIIKELFGLDSGDDSAAEKLMNGFRIDLIGLTLGAGGSILYNKNEKKFHPACSVTVEDTLGAGDAFSALMAVGFMCGWNIEKINEYASEFAGEICKIPGALPEDDSVYKKYVEIIHAGR